MLKYLLNIKLIQENGDCDEYEGLLLSTSGSEEVLGVLSYNTKTYTLTTINPKVTLSKQILLLGHSSKAGKQDRLVGQFGEGLKLGVLACLREGKTIIAETGAETWKFGMETDITFGERTLTVFFDEKRERNVEVNGTLFCVSPIKEWSSWMNDFLFLTKPKDVFESKTGKLLFEERFRHKLYVKGFWIADMDEEGGLQHGVDFNDLQIDRDRRAVIKRHDIDRKLIEMWSEALVKRPELVAAYYDMLRDESCPSDVRLAHKYLNDLAVELLASHFLQKEGVDAFPVWWDGENSKEESKSLTEIGKTPVLVPKTLMQVLSKSSKIGSLSNLLQNYSANQKPIASLSTAQLQVLQRVSQLVQQLDPTFKMSNIEIVKFQKDTMLSSHKISGTIQLSMNLLNVEFVHDNWSDVALENSGNCPNIHNVEFDQEGGCCCRESKILEMIIKEKVLVHDPKAETEVQHKMRHFLNNILFARVLESSFKRQRSESLPLIDDKKLESLKQGSESSVELSALITENEILRKQLKTNLEETNFKLKLAQEKEQLLHESIIQSEQAKSELMSQIQKLKEELKDSKEKIVQLSLVHQSEEIQKQVAEQKVVECETKINTLQQQVYKLITQIDSLKSKAFETEEKHQQELIELRTSLQLLTQKEKQMEKVNSEGQQPTETESKLLAKIDILEAKCRNLTGKDLEKLEQHQLDDLERLTQDTLRSISAAKHALLLKQVETLKRANDKLLEQQQCSICVERSIDTVLLPCRHRCMCSQCSKTLDKCPLCRQSITDRLELFN